MHFSAFFSIFELFFLAWEKVTCIGRFLQFLHYRRILLLTLTSLVPSNAKVVFHFGSMIFAKCFSGTLFHPIVIVVLTLNFSPHQLVEWRIRVRGFFRVHFEVYLLDNRNRTQKWDESH